MQYCTMTCKYGHDDSHVGDDAETEEDKDGENRNNTTESFDWHLTVKDNTFAGASDTPATHVEPQSQKHKGKRKKYITTSLRAHTTTTTAIRLQAGKNQ